MKDKNLLWWTAAILLAAGLGYLVFSQKPAALVNAPAGGAAVRKGPPAPNPALQGEVTVGAVLPLTGERAAEGLAVRRAIEFAVEEVNAANGVGGKKLVVAYEDGACGKDAGAAAARKLVGAGAAPLIIGGVCTEETLGVASVADESKAVAISPAATSPDLTTLGGPYLFRLAPSDAAAARAAARYARDALKAKRAAVISEKTADPQALRAAFTEAFRKAGGVVALDETYAAGVADFRTQAQRIRDARVDVVYLLPGTSASGIAVAEALKEQKVAAAVLASDAFLAGDLRAAPSGLLEGVTGFEAFFDTKSERAAGFLTAYRERFAEEASFPFSMAMGYSVVFLARDLLEKDGPDGPKMQKTLTTLVAGWSGGALGDLTLDAQGDPVWKSFRVKRIEGGAVKEAELLSL